MPRYTAVLDACVLVPIALADTLLRVAEKGLYCPRWSERILGEAQAAIEEIHPGTDAAKRFASMREAFDDATVTGWEELEPESGCPTRTTGTSSQRRSGAARRASSPRTPRTSQPPHSSHWAWRQSTPTTSCSTSSTSARPPSCRSSASRPPTPGGRRSPREIWPPSSAGQAFRTSPTRSSASWPTPSTATDTGMGAAASEDYESCPPFGAAFGLEHETRAGTDGPRAKRPLQRQR